MRRILVAFAAAALFMGGAGVSAYSSEPTIGASLAAAPGVAPPAYTPIGPTLVQRGGEVRVTEAAYGARGRFCDPERTLDRECNGRSRCDFRVGNHLCGDPAEGIVKELRLQFSCGRDREAVSAREGQRVELRCDRGRAEVSVTGRAAAGGPGPSGGRRELQVMDAVYGATGRECSAARAIANRCNGKRECSVRADNRLCGDPAVGNPKVLVITYACRGEQRQEIAREGTTARLRC